MFLLPRIGFSLMGSAKRGVWPRFFVLVSLGLPAAAQPADPPGKAQTVADLLARPAADMKLLADATLPKSSDLRLATPQSPGSEITWLLPWELPEEADDRCDAKDYWQQIARDRISSTTSAKFEIASKQFRHMIDQALADELKRAAAKPPKEPKSGNEKPAAPVSPAEARRGLLTYMWLRAHGQYGLSSAHTWQQTANAQQLLSKLSDEEIQQQVLQHWLLAERETQLVYCFCDDWKELRRSYKLSSSERAQVLSRVRQARMIIRLRVARRECLSDLRSAAVSANDAENVEGLVGTILGELRALTVENRTKAADKLRKQIADAQRAKAEGKAQRARDRAAGKKDVLTEAEYEYYFERFNMGDEVTRKQIARLEAEAKEIDAAIKAMKPHVIPQSRGMASCLAFCERPGSTGLKVAEGEDSLTLNMIGSGSVPLFTGVVQLPLDYAWLRNGAALVDVQISGTLSSDEVRAHLEHVLEVMERKTQPFTSVVPRKG